MNELPRYTTATEIKLKTEAYMRDVFNPKLVAYRDAVNDYHQVFVERLHILMRMEEFLSGPFGRPMPLPAPPEITTETP